MAEHALGDARRQYASRTLAAVGVADPKIESAFAVVRREDFLPPGPWPILQPSGGYKDTPDADPIHLYSDHLVGIAPERGINNGQPRLHAELLSHAAISSGDHVVHIGAGAGYYSAIMAELAGPTGRVTAIEYEQDLAAMAARNLANRSNVSVVHGDGSVVDFDEADVIYVNAGATHPAATWLDRLKQRGRVILPLTTDKGFAPVPRADARRGGVFLITRDGDAFSAKWICGVAIYPCSGLRDPQSERALAEAFARGGWERVTKLIRGAEADPGRCWLKTPSWSLLCD
jgi:protein-L-isoaspartate(D-aspartate) O-methyltransferase